MSISMEAGASLEALSSSPPSLFQVLVLHHPKDIGYRNELEIQLNPRITNSNVRVQYADTVGAWATTARAIPIPWSELHLLVLLLSPDFLDAKGRWLERLKAISRPGLNLITVLLRPSLWEFTPLSGLAALPPSRRPISISTDRTSTWREVIDGLLNAFASLPDDLKGKPTS